MPEHVSHLEYGLIEWIEDQPVTRHVRKQMERDGLIKGLISKLDNSQENTVREVRQYKKDTSASPRDYLCAVQRYIPETSYPNDPSFLIYIKPNIVAYPWDAIGQVYVDDARKLMEEIFKE